MKIYTLNQVANLLQVSEIEVEKLINDKLLKSAKIGDKTIISELDIHNCLLKLGSNGIFPKEGFLNKIKYFFSHKIIRRLLLILSFPIFLIAANSGLGEVLTNLHIFENNVDNAKWGNNHDINPPLNSSVVWKRKHKNPNPEGTHQLLSLI